MSIRTADTGPSARKRWPPDKRRAQLVDCALEAFANHGISRASHAHVATLAKVSKPTVHSYFRTRQDLVAATLGRVDRHMRVMVFRVLTCRSSTFEALIELAHRFADDARDHPAIIKVWLDWSTGIDNDTWPTYLNLLDQLHSDVGTAIRRSQKAGEIRIDIDARAAARVYVGGGHTIALMQFAGVSDRDMDAYISRMVCGALGI